VVNMANEFEKQLPKNLAAGLKENIPSKIAQSKENEIYKRAVEEYEDVRVEPIFVKLKESNEKDTYERILKRFYELKNSKLNPPSSDTVFWVRALCEELDKVSRK